MGVLMHYLFKNCTTNKNGVWGFNYCFQNHGLGNSCSVLFEALLWELIRDLDVLPDMFQLVEHEMLQHAPTLLSAIPGASILEQLLFRCWYVYVSNSMFRLDPRISYPNHSQTSIQFP
jgi:hypothetical protein